MIMMIQLMSPGQAPYGAHRRAPKDQLPGSPPPVIHRTAYHPNSTHSPLILYLGFPYHTALYTIKAV